MNNKLLISFIAFLFILGCKTVEEPVQLGKEYFPIEIGKYRSYQVDSIWFDAFSESTDSLSYFVRETVKDTFRDNEGRLSYLIEVEYTLDTIWPWRLKNVATEIITDFAAERQEFNHRMIKLSLPIRERKSWDENAFNILEEQTNKYRFVSEAYTVLDETYLNTITIDQGDEQDPFFVFIAKEVYAKDVGLVYKTLTDTETQNGIKDGISYTKKLYDTNW